MARASKPLDRDAVLFAVRQFGSHPEITLLGEPAFTAAGAVARFDVDVRLGSRWRARGESPTGVMPYESVQIDFPADFPLSTPDLSLRQDFSRNHPHIQRWLTPDDKRVVPCVVDGDLSEFLAAAGYRAWADQTWTWLDNAAHGRLMQGGRGWEPARRDEAQELLVVDQDRLSALATDGGGFQFFKTRYLGGLDRQTLTPRFEGELGDACTVKHELRERLVDPEWVIGHGLAVAVWPGPGPDKSPFVCDEYLPDDVRTVADLWERARRYGVDALLAAAQALINARAAVRTGKPFPLIVILLARRPDIVLGTSGRLEASTYLAPLYSPAGALAAPDDEVRLVGHRKTITERLLRTLSGDPAAPRWVLLGCGSLGSKVALHAARSGNAPERVGDNGRLLPHNAARHALYPEGSGLAAGWFSAKAEALAETLSGFGREVKPVVGDHADFADTIKPMRGKSRPTWLVNTTASLVARETLARPAFAFLPRGVEMSLFAAGDIGYVGVEGAARNPNAVEVIASLYQQAASDDHLRQRVLRADQLTRVPTGQGCGSVTMVMSDAHLSVMAAAMAELFARLGGGDAGTIHLLRRDGPGLAHDQIEVDAFERAPMEGMPGWTLSISPAVRAKILVQKAQYPKVETGGVLVGWSSVLAQRIVVTDLVDAPIDSQRSPGLFVLGRKGLSDRLAALADSSGGLLTCVGTWHSHLGSARPSDIDRGSAVLVGTCETRPMGLLIVGADGFRAIAHGPSRPRTGQTP